MTTSFLRLSEFASYIRERVNIRERKAKWPMQPDRWTENKVLRMYKFCNARRSWDYTTNWLITQWYKPYKSYDHVGNAAALARFICFVPTLQELGFPTEWNAAQMIRTLEARRARKDKVFTGAYIISAAGGREGDSKAASVIKLALNPVVREKWLMRPWDTCAELYTHLRTVNGWGAFMAQEVIQDLLYTFVLAKAKDRKTFAVAGPGALRGLRWVCGDRVCAGKGARLITEEEGTGLMTELWTLLKEPHSERNPLHLQQVLQADLTVHDIEFNLCEFDKFMRTTTGSGNPPRSRYVLNDHGQTTLEL